MRDVLPGRRLHHFFPMRRGRDLLEKFMTVHFSPLLFSPSSTPPIAFHITFSNGEENHREDRGAAAGRKLLLTGVLPSEDSNGGVTPAVLV